MALVLQLTTISASDVVGIYDVGGKASQMPPRTRFLHPAAADSFLGPLHEKAIVSDMFRTPESSLAAVRAGRGAMPPGYSAHNYGLAIDLDIRPTMKRVGVKTKEALDDWMENLGWFCHRRDHAMDSEAWHYNFLGVGTAISAKVRATAGYVEAKILGLYGDSFELDAESAQGALQTLRIYRGEIDGDWGPLSREACRVFQRGWGLTDTGKLDGRTQRTLAYVAADRVVI